MFIAVICVCVFNMCFNSVFCVSFGFLLFSQHRFLIQEPLSSSLSPLLLSSLFSPHSYLKLGLAGIFEDPRTQLAPQWSCDAGCRELLGIK